jgi:hypothetical protein
VSTSPRFVPPIDESKVPPEVAQHLRLVYDRLQNHYEAVQNLTSQISSLQSQVNTLQGK